MKIAAPLIVYLQDSRDVEISRFGKGNNKIGESIYTFSRLPRRDGGTCPGSTPWCERFCYAQHVDGLVRDVWRINTQREIPPEIPADCRLLRLHVSGDFTTELYIERWRDRLLERPDVRMWTYTRSWRIPRLLQYLERLRTLPNVQVFASMDESTLELPPIGWRVAWIKGDPLQRGYVCPEETGRKRDCESCRFCFLGTKGDVVFLRH